MAESSHHFQGKNGTFVHNNNKGNNKGNNNNNNNTIIIIIYLQARSVCENVPQIIEYIYIYIYCYS